MGVFLLNPEPRPARSGTITLPHLAVGGFEVAGEGCGVEKGGGSQGIAKGGAGGGWGRGILREGGRDVDVIGGGLGDEVGTADGREEAGAHARHVDGAGEGYHRDAHPEGVAGGGGAVVGVRVEGDVDLVVGGEVIVEAG